MREAAAGVSSLPFGCVHWVAVMGFKVPVLWLPWGTLPSPLTLGIGGGGQSQFGILKGGSLWRTPLPSTPGGKEAPQRKWRGDDTLGKAHPAY